MSTLVQAHIAAQARLRAIAVAETARAWALLPAYDERNVAEWLARVLPLVNAAQRQSVSLTEAFLALALGRGPIGVPPAGLIGAAVRNGTPPQDVYRRPFVTVWTALKAGAAFTAATKAGLVRARSTVAMDVQLSQRATLQAVQVADPAIRGYRRVADPGACAFCVTVDGAVVNDAAAMGLHNHCGCTLEPLTEATAPTPLPDDVAVHHHGELGAMLADPGQHFTTEHELH